MTRLSFKLALVGFGIITLSACGPLRDFHEMHDSTLKMNQTTAEMNTTTAKMAETTLQMASNMATMLKHLTELSSNMKDLRIDIGNMASQMTTLNGSIVIMANQMSGLSGDIEKMGTTLDLTHSDLRLIFTGEHRINVLRAMENATDQITKMGYAAEYMISQTYQSWNAKIDSPESRLELMGIAVPDFFYKVHIYSAKRTSVDPSLTDPQSMNLFAIAFTLDYLNVIEVDGLKGSDQKPVTMLSMIEDGLKASLEVDNNKKQLTELPLYQREIYNHRQEAIYLLQVRHNFLKGVAFTLLSTDQNGTPQSKAASFWDVLKARVVKINWDADLGSKDIAQLEVITTTLDAAAETEKFLLDTGNKLKIYANVSELLRKIDLSALQSRATAPEVDHFNHALAQVIELDQK